MENDKWIKQDKPLVIARRGYSIYALENTMSAYRKTTKIGSGGIIGDDPSLIRSRVDVKGQYQDPS